jgi:hypothetical protein
MSRNNQDRLGSRADGSDSPIQETLNNSPSPQMQFVVPTEFVELPSGGSFYPEDHPLHEQTEIEIKFMTAKEEDILTDKTLLKKGLAIDRLIKSIVINKNIQPDSLYVGDRNAILVAARISGYGADYETKVVCPVCLEHGRHEFDLESARSTSQPTLDGADIRQTPAGTVIFTTPKMGVEVECKMLTGADEKQLLSKQRSDKEHRLPERNLTNHLKTILVSVNGNSDRSYINSFIEAVTAGDSRYIRTTYQKCIPNVELKEEYVCGECGASTMLDVPFTTDFFWPK